MARISDEDIQKVREATDIVAIIGERVPLRQKGREFWCCCPFHNEKTPSCKIDPATQLWHCFGCGEGGDVFGFVMKSDDVTFPDAVRTLAERAHIDIKETGGKSVSSSRKARLRDVCSATRDFYHIQLMRGKGSQAENARNYLASRGFGGDVPKEWMLGFAPGNGSLVKHLQGLGFTAEEMIEANVAVSRQGNRLNDRFYDRVIFPISDAQGECIAFGGRVIGDGEPKYLNSQETPLFHKSSVLYGLDKAKAAMTSTGDAIVVEGYTDVIALHEQGIKNAVATLGTALTLQHIRLLSRHASKRIIYLFDGDAAGQRAADRALGFINEDMTPEAGKTRVELYAVTLPDDLDPAEFVEKEGAAGLNELLAEAKPLVLYGIERRMSAHDLNTIEGRTRAFADCLSVLAPIKDSLLAKDYAIEVAGRLQMRESDALTALAALEAPKAYDADSERKPSAPVSQVVITEGEKSRRRIERRFLSLLAQNPAEAMTYADALARTRWHDETNGTLAKALLDELSHNPKIAPASLIAQISQSVPDAANALTSARIMDGQSLGDALGYLAEELEIGDTEEELSALKLSLKQDTSLPEKDRDLIFHSIVDLQNALNEKRQVHRPAL